MLFARFLAENNLLIHEKEGMPVTLAECDELAVDEGAPDGWTLAARYASRMLPQIFRPDDPVLQIGFAPEHKRALEKLVNELPVEIFTAADSLGWVYQFWQADRKDEVNKSGEKITGETLPAVTQLFTEHYMVLFLLHNTIGAWWAAKLNLEGRIQKSEWDRCQTEDDCRKLVALPGYEFIYLRFIKDSNGEWVPAAGGFPGWPKSLKDFKLFDPCCGSGHFLVAAFTLLVRMRMRDEMISAKEACDAVLRENLHGLELDARCTQIAAFALAITAWKFPSLPVPLSGAESTLAFSLQPSALPLGFRPLPSLNIACSGLGVNARKEDWLALANDDTRLRSGLEQLYDLFQKAPELGSLINPRTSEGDLLVAAFHEIRPLLEMALAQESKNELVHEMAVTARGLSKAAEILAAEFTLVVTNVPYLGRGKQNDELKNYCENTHSDAKADLATCFLQRCLGFLSDSGTAAVVTPQAWWFAATYKMFRNRLLVRYRISMAATLGEEAWQTFADRGPIAALLVVNNEVPSSGDLIATLDALPRRTIIEKIAELSNGEIRAIPQELQLANPNHRISVNEPISGMLLESRADAYAGILNGDSPRFVHHWWEIPRLDGKWEPLLVSPSETRTFGGRDAAILWEGGKGQLEKFAIEARETLHDAHRRGNAAWGRWGVAIVRMRDLKATLYCGELFDQAVSVISPKSCSDLLPIWCLAEMDELSILVRKVNPNFAISSATVAEIPFNLPHWQKVASEKYPHGLPKPFSSDPTQWLFDGHPKSSDQPLHVAVARLLTYEWPRQTGSSFPDCPALGTDGLEKLADQDGIVCIPSLRGEQPAAERLRTLLVAAYGEAWNPAQLDELLSALDYAGSNLEDWLRNGFFDQHSKLFHHRPFIWHIWDGRKDGFSALVNYHKLDHKLLEKLTYTYLGEWIKKQQEAVAKEESGADDRLVKAQQLQNKLKLILDGEAPYDIFVRWKELAIQPIGWNPDLNDGVRLNIRPFMEADVLRKRPNIKWGVDRGKNPPGSPWGEERDNDRHLTLEEKRTEGRNQSSDTLA